MWRHVMQQLPAKSRANRHGTVASCNFLRVDGSVTVQMVRIRKMRMGVPHWQMAINVLVRNVGHDMTSVLMCDRARRVRGPDQPHASSFGKNHRQGDPAVRKQQVASLLVRCLAGRDHPQQQPLRLASSGLSDPFFTTTGV